MRMDDMNKTLEKIGFNVEMKYIPEDTTYSFTVWKNGLDKLTLYFPYPKEASYIDRDKIQRKFINDLECEYEVKFGPMIDAKIDFLDKKMNIPKSTAYIPSIKKVIFNYPATIILWADGTKTVVKCDGEDYDPEKGMAMAIAKKVLGNKGNYYNKFKKWLPVPKPISGCSWNDVINAVTKLGEDFKKFNSRKKDS